MISNGRMAMVLGVWAQRFKGKENRMDRLSRVRIQKRIVNWFFKIGVSL
jgi:hypothetical protein